MRPADEYLKAYKHARLIEENQPQSATARLLRRLWDDLKARWERDLGPADRQEVMRREPGAVP